MTRLTTVLFDLDGTLIDSIRLILDSYHHTLASHGIASRSDDEWLAGIGTPLQVQFAEWAESPGIEAMIATYRDYNLAHHDTRVLPYPGIVEMVRTVRQAGLLTGLVTSKNRSGALRGLRLCGLDEAMDVLVGADDVEHPKPHPEPVLKALSALGQPAESAMYIGDSIHDMQAGRAAGVLTAAVLWGPFGREHLEGSQPDFWLDRPDQLQAVVSKLSAGLPAQ